jgi:hypothetical protein
MRTSCHYDGVETKSAGSQLRVVRSEKLVVEARDSSGTHRKGNVCRRKFLPSSTVKTMTENTSPCVTVICKV